MKNCFTICVDMDDTIENLLEAWVAELDKRYNLNVAVDDIKEWRLEKSFPTLTTEQIYEPLYSREFWKTVAPKEDAIFYLKKLIDEAQQIYICTSSHYRTVQMKIEEILEKYFPYLGWRNIIVTHDKQMIKCDILVDDGIHNLEGGEYHKVLFHSIANSNYDAEANGMYRAYNWSDVYNYVKILDILYIEEGRKTI